MDKEKNRKVLANLRALEVYDENGLVGKWIRWWDMSERGQKWKWMAVVLRITQE